MLFVVDSAKLRIPLAARVPQCQAKKIGKSNTGETSLKVGGQNNKHNSDVKIRPGIGTKFETFYKQ